MSPDASPQNSQPLPDQDGIRRRGAPKDSPLVEGQPAPSPLGSGIRRTSSVLSNSSLESRRRSIFTPTEDFLLSRVPGPQEELHQESTLWHSLPILALAIIPSIGGVFFKQGSIVITDIALLLMAAVYLNWVLVTPWALYHSAQTVKIAKPPLLETINEESDDEADDSLADMPAKGRPASSGESGSTLRATSGNPEHSTHERAALRELQIHELFALGLCFVGPLIGAYILHIIRNQISVHDLMSNLHLTLFILGAELRPVRHLIKLLQVRTLHLQRLVREDPHAADQIDTALVQELMDRVNAVESNVSEIALKSLSTVDQNASVTQESVKKAQHMLQTQVDALNRAVRRYEKRATAQTVQNESRLHDLETRLKDALSLAAAAASYSQRNGMLQVLFDYTKTIVLFPLLVCSKALRLPLQALNGAASTVLVRLGIARPARRKRSTGRQASLYRVGQHERVPRTE